MASQRQLILASGSPRRKQLLESAGYQFEVVAPDPGAECGICSGESPAQLVARYAFQKAKDVASRLSEGMILAADTVADCDGQVLGKPRNDDHAREMLTRLSGRDHAVCTGVCLWELSTSRVCVDVVRTELSMDQLSAEQIDDYVASGLWEGKAGGFGYQDGNDWLCVLRGSESNVVGLPMERLRELLTTFDSVSRPIGDFDE